MASPSSGAIEMTRMLRATFTASVGWIESVMTSSFSLEARDARDRAAGEDAVGDVGVDLLGAVRRAALRRRCTSVPPESTMSSTRMQERPSTSPMMFMTSDLAGALAALVDDGERRVDALGERAGAHHAADVGRDDHEVAEVEPLLDVADHDGGGEQVVGRDVEEALDLPGVEIERQHAVGAGVG